MKFSNGSEGFIVGGALCILFIILMGIAAVVGWGTNIYKFASADFQAPYKNEILRGIGIPFTPLGVVLGYLHIDDGKIIEVRTRENK